MGESKKLINTLFKYGICCSYDEHIPFKKSAAIAAAEKIKLAGIADASNGLVQGIVDNFDADISSPNGKQSTHSLAILLTQYSCNTTENENQENRSRIKRLRRNSTDVPYDVKVSKYQGSKQPMMQETCNEKPVPLLKMLCEQAISERRASEFNYSFMKEIITKDGCPEYNGYSTKDARESGQYLKPKTKAVYLPLIDLKPSDPDTMLTAMEKVQELTNQTGQPFTVLTCDQQLYRIAVQVKWNESDRFRNMYLRLGGMHALMSFVGSIGTLMKESGLEDILSQVFGGVPKMLTGKKFPQNVRALRILAEETLRVLFENHDFESVDDLTNALKQISSESRTSKLWVDVIIRPVFFNDGIY